MKLRLHFLYKWAICHQFILFNQGSLLPSLINFTDIWRLNSGIYGWRLFYDEDQSHKKIPSTIEGALFRKIQILDAATQESDLRIPPFEKRLNTPSDTSFSSSSSSAFIMSLGTNWGLDLAINGNGWKQTANDDLIKSVCYLPLLAVVFRYLPTLLPDTKARKNTA